MSFTAAVDVHLSAGGLELRGSRSRGPASAGTSGVKRSWHIDVEGSHVVVPLLHGPSATASQTPVPGDEPQWEAVMLNKSRSCICCLSCYNKDERWMFWAVMEGAARLADQCHTVMLPELPAANQSMWLTVAVCCGTVRHKCTNNKIYSEASAAGALNHSQSSCDKTATAYREDLIKFLSWTLKTSGPPPSSPRGCVTAAKDFFFFYLVTRWLKNYQRSEGGGSRHTDRSGDCWVLNMDKVSGGVSVWRELPQRW